MGKDTTKPYRRKKALIKENGSPRIISPVPPSSGILRGPEEKAAQSSPGGKVC